MKTLPLLLLLVACKDSTDGVVDSNLPKDGDGDGYFSEEDCDDADPNVNAGAEERCDGVDNDCDGVADEDAVDALAWYADADADGWGAGEATLACEAPSGQVEVDGDCDDADPLTHPTAEEDCADPVDRNCDGSVGYADNDADGWAACEECDDNDPSVHPDAVEVCDDVDNDCDGLFDDADDSLDLSTAERWYADTDADGYGDPDAEQRACEAPAEHVADSSDCDDGDVAVNPAATERCDGVDNNCDGDTDEDSAADAGTWYADTDGDGFGDADDVSQACAQPSGAVADDSDCDDRDAAVNPDATERCDGVDNNCDGDIDEDSAADASAWYADTDGDGYGDAASSLQTCDQPSGHVADASDCDDASATTFPGAALHDSASQCMGDADGDGYGDDNPGSGVTAGTDCDDSDSAVNPAATEVCDSVDNDCDGSADGADAADALTWYADTDADGYGDAASSQLACDPPSGAVSDATDCDDSDSATFPGAAEACDAADNDCDSGVDEGVLGSGGSCAAESCAAVLADQPSAASGAYSIDPNGSGSALSLTCEMAIDGGGWTQATASYLQGLTSGPSREYLYVYGAAFYISPSTTTIWSWSSYSALNGTYSYASSGTTPTGSFSCTHAESGHWGVGCSNGGGRQFKVLPWGSVRDSAAATSNICQDRPDVFGVGACTTGVAIYVR